MAPLPLVNVTVCGSFNRHLTQIQHAVEALGSAGAVVLSPLDPQPRERRGPFLFLAGDSRRSVKGTESRHLDAIASSVFVWLECPDGYVGASAAFELGYAAACRVPVFAARAPEDLTMRQYVQPPQDLAQTVAQFAAGCQAPTKPAGIALLLDPGHALSAAHAELEHIGVDLVCMISDEHDPVERRVAKIAEMLALPGHCPLGWRRPATCCRLLNAPRSGPAN